MIQFFFGFPFLFIIPETIHEHDFVTLQIQSSPEYNYSKCGISLDYNKLDEILRLPELIYHEPLLQTEIPAGDYLINPPIESNNLNFVGISQIEFLNIFEIKNEILEGRFFEKNDFVKTEIHDEFIPILISKNFALLNNLSVNSELKLHDEIFFIPPIIYFGVKALDKRDETIIGDRVYNFKVIGIFTSVSKYGNPNFTQHRASFTSFHRFKYADNTILVPDYFARELIHHHVSTEYNFNEELFRMYQWHEFAYDSYKNQLIKDEICQNPIFVVDQDKLDSFISKANNILGDCYEMYINK